MYKLVVLIGSKICFKENCLDIICAVVKISDGEYFI